MMLYRYSTALETTIYEGRKADYIFFLLFCSVLLIASTAVYPSVILGHGLLSSLLYLWSRKNPDLVLTLLFGIRIKAIYLPWAMCGFKMLQGGSPIIDLIGIVVGHVWYFVTDLYPLQSGRQILKTPEILYTWFPSPNAQRPRGVDNNAPAGGRHAWGQGHRLN